MDSALLAAILCGVGGMIGWGTADFFAKKSLEKVDEFALTFWMQVVGVVPVLLFVVGKHQLPEFGLATLGFLILFGIADAVDDVLLYRGYAKGKVSILSPIFASYAGLVILLSFVFFDEPLSTFAVVGLLITFLGIMLINVDVKDIRNSLRRPHAVDGVPAIAGAAIIYAVWLVLFDRVVSGNDWAFFLLVARSAEAVALLAYARARKKPLKIARSHKVWPYVVLLGLFDVMAYTFLTLGFSISNYTSVVAVLSASFSLPTLILAHRYLHEKITRIQLVAVGLIVLGVVIVAAI